MNVPKPYSNNAATGGAGHLSGILFQNIGIAEPRALGEPQRLWGLAHARIRNPTFGGKPVHNPAFFRTNEFADGLAFELSTASKP